MAKVRVKMRTPIAGERWHARKGQVIEMEADEAARMIERGYAEPVGGGDEAAVLEAPETAAVRVTRAKGKKA